MHRLSDGLRSRNEPVEFGMPEKQEGEARRTPPKELFMEEKNLDGIIHSVAFPPWIVSLKKTAGGNRNAPAACDSKPSLAADGQRVLQLLDVQKIVPR
jgi:hypothetical protein